MRLSVFSIWILSRPFVNKLFSEVDSRHSHARIFDRRTQYDNHLQNGGPAAIMSRPTLLLLSRAAAA